MPPLFKMFLFIIANVLQLVQYCDGNQRVVHVSELISDDIDFITSGEDDISCVYGNCSYSSLYHALANLNNTSNVLINITTDVTLSSLIEVLYIENITIIGHNNQPTVNCADVGGIHFTCCRNCIIKGITWDGCGIEYIDDHTIPGIKVSNSSNIIIENCSFKYTRGQAVSLSDVSGYVNINHCYFLYNNHYRGHGAAIHSSSKYHHLTVFTISYCNFAYNKNAESLVYIANKILEHNVTFHYLKFCHNQGVSIYAINQKIYFNGKNLFQSNMAENGAGIYIKDYSTVAFGKNSNVKFLQSTNHKGGGVVFLTNHSHVIFDQNSVASFSRNTHSSAICSEISSNITFKTNCKVTFSENSALYDYSGSGGAISCYNNSHICFEGESSAVFTNNTAYVGGALYSDVYSYISFKGNSSPVFTNNSAHYGGGAIFSYDISFEGNASPVFTNNTVVYGGGAILSEGSMLFKSNSSPVFSNNIAEYGGALSTVGNGNITFSENCTITFINNSATVGATIISYNSEIRVTDNSNIIFNTFSARWCTYPCLPYTGQCNGVTVLVDSDGTVWCSAKKTFKCLSKQCYCRRLEDLLNGIHNNQLINITDNSVTLSSRILLSDLKNISIIGYNNVTVLCVNNGGLYVGFCTDVVIEGFTWIGCGSHNVTIYIPVIGIHNSSIVLQNCTFQYSLSPVINLPETGGTVVNINYCNFVNNNQYTNNGAAIFLYPMHFTTILTLNINNCNFIYNGNGKSIIHFKPHYDSSLVHIHLNNSTFHNNRGVSFYISNGCTLYINGKVIFEDNVAKDGAGIYISENSTIIFDKNSNVKFINNSVDHSGAAIVLTPMQYLSKPL